MTKVEKEKKEAKGDNIDCPQRPDAHLMPSHTHTHTHVETHTCTYRRSASPLCRFAIGRCNTSSIKKEGDAVAGIIEKRRGESQTQKKK